MAYGNTPLQSLATSLSAHLLILLALIYWPPSPSPFSIPGAPGTPQTLSVWIGKPEQASEPGHGQPFQSAFPPRESGGIGGEHSEKAAQGPAQKPLQIIGTGENGAGGLSLADGAPDALLTAIQARLEAAKQYPREALVARVSGTAEIRFSVGADGAPRDISLIRSSGSALLDREALETVTRAAPFPAYPTALAVPIAFRLSR